MTSKRTGNDRSAGSGGLAGWREGVGRGGGGGGLLRDLGGVLGLGFEPFVEGDGEGEELLFAVEGVDHFDVELGVFEGGVVELADVVEEVSGEGGVRFDGGGLEAEIGVVVRDLFVDGCVVDGDGDDGDLGAHGGAGGEETAIDVLEGGCGNDVVIGGDELDANVVEGERVVGVVGDDDADGDEAVLDIGKAKEVAGPGIEAGVGGDGDVLVGVGVEGDVLGGGFDGRRGLFLIEGVCDERAEHGCSECDEAKMGAGSRGHADGETRLVREWKERLRL